MKRFLQRVLKLIEVIQMVLYFTLFIGPVVAVGTRVPDWPYQISYRIVFPVGTVLLVILLILLNMLIGGLLSRFLGRLELGDRR